MKLKTIQLITNNEKQNISGGSCICLRYVPEIRQIPVTFFDVITAKECKKTCCSPTLGADTYTCFDENDALLGAGKCPPIYIYNGPE